MYMIYSANVLEESGLVYKHILGKVNSWKEGKADWK